MPPPPVRLPLFTSKDAVRRLMDYGQPRIIRHRQNTLTVSQLLSGMRQTWRVNAFAEATNQLDEESFQALYGPWDPLAPEQVAELLSASGIRWWIAGGRAARAGALTAGCHQLWVRHDSRQPWRMEFLVDYVSTDEEWVFKGDTGVRVPWARAAHTVDGIHYIRPEIALLYKASQDRPKDRADLAAARLDPDSRGWLADTLERLGHHEWAGLARR